ncbi:protein kinase domain-containing protein [Endozoicomonas numazuensis]|uniref:Protein kinase domain-containing protein n=1 Tax=Endozoicomonas numazuensis TaxID=1137799 RepID=A0A081NM97_9GAMM|nr:protein kinase [Endozoicomonas numazuensis]KEQ19570.1 hypothetical protein GZ78_06595 [Endozoicomonas numazuensis]
MDVTSKPLSVHSNMPEQGSVHVKSTSTGQNTVTQASTVATTGLKTGVAGAAFEDPFQQQRKHLEIFAREVNLPSQKMQRLGQGSWGTVYKVTTQAGSESALKVNRAPGLEAELRVDPNRAEVLALGLPPHPNVMKVESFMIGHRKTHDYKVISDPSQLRTLNLEDYFIAGVRTEVAKGESLYRLGYCITAHCVERVFYQLAEALSHLHSYQCAHRDISVLNIVVNPETYELKLIDMGSAKTTLQRSESYVGASQLLESEGYSPLFKPKPHNAMALDLWEMGCVMFFCLTKRPIENFNSRTRCLDAPRSLKEGEENRPMYPSHNAKNFAELSDQDKKAIIFSYMNREMRGYLDPVCLELVAGLLRFDPSKRPSAATVKSRLESRRIGQTH